MYIYVYNYNDIDHVFQDMKVNCLAVINDTVGALMSCAHSDNLCAIGLILGKPHIQHQNLTSYFKVFNPYAAGTESDKPLLPV